MRNYKGIVSKLRWKIAQWAERIWWRRYLKNKSVEDYLAWKKEYWKKFLRQINVSEKEVSGQKTIDLGCGPAGIFILFDQATAVDPLLDKYDQDLSHFSKTDYPYNRFITSSVENFVPQEKYDTIFCINAINHVSDLEKGIGRLSDCAHENSQLIISIDAHNHNFLKKIFQWLPGDILHPHQYNLNEYLDKIKTQGWDIIKTVEMDQAFIFNYYVIVAKRNA